MSFTTKRRFSDEIDTLDLCVSFDEDGKSEPSIFSLKWWFDDDLPWHSPLKKNTTKESKFTPLIGVK